jgi:hypothetical protein
MQTGGCASCWIVSGWLLDYLCRYIWWLGSHTGGGVEGLHRWHGIRHHRLHFGGLGYSGDGGVGGGYHG